MQKSCKEHKGNTTLPGSQSSADPVILGLVLEAERASAAASPALFTVLTWLQMHCLLLGWLTVVSLNPAAAFSAPSRITRDSNSLPVPSFRRLQGSASSSVKVALWIPQSVFWVSDSSWGHTYGYPKHRLVGPGVNFTAFQLGESGLVPKYGTCPAWGSLTHSVQTNLSFSRGDVAPLTF